MNTFAQIVDLGIRGKVHLYSVQIGDEDSEFVKWIKTHKGIPEIEEEFNIVREWLDVKICKQKGALERYFRHERAAVALPPISQHLPHKLRLYCFRINDNALVLFNGGIKTARWPEDCNNVRAHFRLANQVSNQIQAGFVEGLIVVDEQGDMTIHPEFVIQL